MSLVPKYRKKPNIKVWNNWNSTYDKSNWSNHFEQIGHSLMYITILSCLRLTLLLTNLSMAPKCYMFKILCPKGQGPQKGVQISENLTFWPLSKPSYSPICGIDIIVIPIYVVKVFRSKTLLNHEWTNIDIGTTIHTQN